MAFSGIQKIENHTIAQTQVDKEAQLACVLGRRVRSFRNAIDVSIDVAAAVIDVSASDFMARESGSQRFTPSELVRLCDLLHIMPSSLFDSFNDQH